MTTSIVLIIISFVLIIVALKTHLRLNRISKNGVLTEGIIFEMENSNNVNTRLTYPIVRFITKSDTWITKADNTSILPGFYKIGAKVQIMYDPNNPSDFFIKSSYTKLIPFVLIFSAILFIITGIINLLHV